MSEGCDENAQDDKRTTQNLAHIFVLRLKSGRIIVTGTVSVNKKLPIRGICFDCSPVFQFSRTLAEECPAETRGLRGFREVVLVLTVANNKGFLSHASVTTNSKPSLVGSKVINAGEPSSFLREATWLFQPTRAQCGNTISSRRRERRLRCSETILCRDSRARAKRPCFVARKPALLRRKPSGGSDAMRSCVMLPVGSPDFSQQTVWQDEVVG